MASIWDKKIKKGTASAEKPIEESIDESKLAIIDADFMAYWFGQETFTVDTEKFTIKSSEEACLRAELYLYGLLNRVGASHYIGFYQEGESFRNKLCPEYKANRKNKEKPAYYSAIRKTLSDKYNMLKSYSEYLSLIGIGGRFETDDLCASLSTRMPKAIIISNDKDVLNLPGRHYNVNSEEFVESTQDSYERFVLGQMIIGDTADNIKGLPKKGEVYVRKLFKDIPTKELPAIVLSEYTNMYPVQEAVKLFNMHYELLFLKQDLFTKEGLLNGIKSNICKIDYSNYDLLLKKSQEPLEEPESEADHSIRLARRTTSRASTGTIRGITGVSMLVIEERLAVGNAYIPANENFIGNVYRIGAHDYIVEEGNRLNKIITTSISVTVDIIDNNDIVLDRITIPDADNREGAIIRKRGHRYMVLSRNRLIQMPDSTTTTSGTTTATVYSWPNRPDESFIPGSGTETFTVTLPESAFDNNALIVGTSEETTNDSSFEEIWNEEEIFGDETEVVRPDSNEEPQL